MDTPRDSPDDSVPWEKPLPLTGISDCVADRSGVMLYTGGKG
jgi:hypothetical protein